MNELLGENNVSNLDLKELGRRFSTVTMHGKLVNIGDDIEANLIKNSAMFKKVVTGERINAEQKGQPMFEFKPHVKLLFSTNNISKIGLGDDSEALIRRLIIIPFEAKFTPQSMGQSYKPFIINKLKNKEAIEYLINLGVEGLKRVLKSNEFTKSNKVTKEIEEYKEIINPMIVFFKSINIKEIINKQTSDVFRKYQIYCYDSSIEPTNKIDFSRRIIKQFNLDTKIKTIHGKSTRIFIRKY